MYKRQTQEVLRNILIEENVPFVEADGEAAFYGPKIDIQAKNVYGKEAVSYTHLDVYKRQKSYHTLTKATEYFYLQGMMEKTWRMA